MQPEVAYARIEHAAVAYQVVGDGPLDVVFLPEWVNNLEMQWQDPKLARFPTRLASFARVVMLNTRGIGLSDPLPHNQSPTVERWMDDITAVMDAVGSRRAALLGTGIGGSLALVFAATYPERVSALVLVNATARSSAAPDYPFGIDAEWREATQQEMAKSWGRAAILELRAPEMAGDARFREWYSRFERYGASPGTALDVLRMIHGLDVRHVFPAIQCPVLVIHRSEDSMVRVEHGRYLSEHLPDARFVELPGAGHAYWSGDQDRIIDETQAFLTGAPAEAAIDRVLVTVLFTDIVGSTDLAARVGDLRWSELLDEHRVLVRRELERFRGREVDTVGDGFVATFDGPGRAIRCAAAIRDALLSIGLQIRAGLHTGEIELRADDIAGIAIHIAARVQAEAEPAEVLVSRTVVDLVAGSGIRFDDRGSHELKGVPGQWELFAADLPVAA
ncbi:MAG: adenylate/guanylate cyclase domain-containing protein [Acidimicrobiia bacterium]